MAACAHGADYESCPPKSVAKEFNKADQKKKTFRELFKSLSEANAGPDTVTLTIPLFIRVLEWAREDAKDDIEVHKFVENAIKHSGVMDTDCYEDLLP